jgi:uncharacterized membrane protein
MQEMIQNLVLVIAGAAEAAAALVIVTGMVQALWMYFSQSLFGRYRVHGMSSGRLRLGHALSLALELLIGADILKSAISPSWEELGQLAAIVGIRTVLNYFLLYEIRTLSHEEGREEGAASPAR